MVETMAGFFMAMGVIALALDFVVLAVVSIAYWTQRDRRGLLPPLRGLATLLREVDLD